MMIPKKSAKAFLVSIVVMPLLMFGGIFVQRQTAKMGDVKAKRLAVIDRSPGGQLFDAMNQRAITRNATDLKDETGRRAVFGDVEKFQTDGHFRDHVPFHEYFHGDTGRGVGATHQTGWTGLLAVLMSATPKGTPVEPAAIRSAATAALTESDHQAVGIAR